MLTEEQNPNSRWIDQKSIKETLQIINAEDKKVASSVEKELPNIAQAAQTIINSIKKGGKLHLVGAGTSGRLCMMQQAELPPTFNTPPKQTTATIAGGKNSIFKAKEGAEDNKKIGYETIQKLAKPNDTLIGVTASGKTPFVLGAVQSAKKIGCKTIGISCNPNPRIAKIADININPIVGPEVIAGSTRMKAGTAQKMVLDMLTTTAMIKLGKVYDNLMIDVQPRSKKLSERAKKITAIISKESNEKVEETLKKTKYNIKTAIIMLKRKCSLEEAEKLLKENNGVVKNCF